MANPKRSKPSMDGLVQAPVTQEDLKHCQAVADAEHDGNVAAYIRALVKIDRSRRERMNKPVRISARTAA